MHVFSYVIVQNLAYLGSAMPGNRCDFRDFFLIFLFSAYPNPNPKPSPTPKPNHKPNQKPNHKPNLKPNHKPNPEPNPIIINYGLKDT